MTVEGQGLQRTWPPPLPPLLVRLALAPLKPPDLPPPSLSCQVSILHKNIERLLEASSRRLGAEQELAWLDVLQRLESAVGVVKGSGPGGDL